MADTNQKRRQPSPRKDGLRRVTLWVTDTSTAGFDEECARQAKLVAATETVDSRHEDSIWFEVSDKAGWQN